MYDIIEERSAYVSIYRVFNFVSSFSDNYKCVVAFVVFKSVWNDVTCTKAAFARNTSFFSKRDNCRE